MSYSGALYRALNPIHARDPLSGRGAELHGGRFNPKGIPGLYASLTIMTAVSEANQVGSLQPTTLVSYEAEIERVFDTRDAAALADDTWRDQMKAMGAARTQAFGQRLAAQGYHGLMVRSFAPGAGADDLNLVLWRWGPVAPSRLTLLDDEKPLSR